MFQIQVSERNRIYDMYQIFNVMIIYFFKFNK
jgi:hypothetical protein